MVTVVENRHLYFDGYSWKATILNYIPQQTISSATTISILNPSIGINYVVVQWLQISNLTTVSVTVTLSDGSSVLASLSLPASGSTIFSLPLPLTVNLVVTPSNTVVVSGVYQSYMNPQTNLINPAVSIQT